MSTDFPAWYQAELNSTADDTSVSQTIAKPNVISRFDKDVFTPPFRLGRKQKRAILDAKGIAVIIMPHNSEKQAQLYCDYLNGL